MGKLWMYDERMLKGRISTLVTTEAQGEISYFKELEVQQKEGI